MNNQTSEKQQQVTFSEGTVPLLLTALLDIYYQILCSVHQLKHEELVHNIRFGWTIRSSRNQFVHLINMTANENYSAYDVAFDYIILMSIGNISNVCSVVSPSSFINLVSITQ